MPLYTCECNSCQNKQDYFSTVAERDTTPKCEMCGGETKKILSFSSVVPDFQPYLDPNIGGPDGVWVKSKQHRKQLMKKYGVEEKVGKGWW